MPKKAVKHDDEGWRRFLASRHYHPAYHLLPGRKPITLADKPINHPRGK